jgi:hypothetical protein
MAGASVGTGTALNIEAAGYIGATKAGPRLGRIAQASASGDRAARGETGKVPCR